MKTLYIVLLLLAAGAAYGVSQTGGGNDGVDKYGTLITLTGVFRDAPYQSLEVEDGGATQTWVLTSQGKTNVMEVVADAGNRRVELEGTPISRANMRVFEVAGIRTLGSEALPTITETDRGAVTLKGEIVDTKCAMGRMKPGEGVVHRECAIRCIRGGIPPTLMVPDGSDVRFYLLEGPAGERLNEAVIDFVADPVRVTGTLIERGDLEVLRLDPTQIERLGD